VWMCPQFKSCNMDRAFLYKRAIKIIEWHEREEFHKIVKVTASCLAFTRKTSHECSPRTKSDLDSIKRISYRDDIDFTIYMSFSFTWSIESYHDFQLFQPCAQCISFNLHAQ
jgi:hypothetical protein